MANEEISYPFDPTGQNPLNRVANEQQPITSVNFRDYHYIVPRWAPFFAASLTMIFHNPDGSVRPLVEGVDYYLGYQFIQASKACAAPVYGAIQFLDTDLAGVLRINYQTVGGTWTLDEAGIAEILANQLYNPRTTSWEQVVERPVDFPVIDHEWDLVDMVGASEIVDAINDVRDAITAGTGGGLEAHVANKSNPHEVTALQVGLGNVQNYPIATTAQAQVGTNATTYMTPATTAAAIAALGSSNLQAHLNDLSNPHATTKAQVGLSNVPNYAMATNAEALTGTSTTTFMSPALTAAVVAVVNAALTAHTNNTNNPHQTTKDQIVLFNVQNYGISTAQQAQDGTDNASYMTPLRVKQAVAAQANTGLANHLADTSNPHGTTKGQVGLGNVDNFATASSSDATDISSANKFMTPQRTAAAITFFVGTDFLNHLNAANPHGTTKAQVGLGSVDNFATATLTDAQTGTASNLFMTPVRVKDAITFFVGTDLTNHTSNTNNPHGTTATQVGLGNVPNFVMATQAEAEAGLLAARFMSPLQTKQAITFQIGTAFTAHAAASNPHGTTKADVGLNLVNNYATANDAEAAQGISGTLYLTPRGGALLLNASLGGHLTDQNNPHQTTKAQVGLGSVSNYAIATDTDATDGTSNVLYVTPRTANIAAQAVLATHSGRSDNPHNTTAAQVGLGSVQNYGLATTVEAQQGNSSVKYMTPSLTAAAITAQVPILLNVHASRTDNPHATTATQVGAYTTQEVDQLLLAKLGSTQTATNSTLLAGNTLAQVISQANSASINTGLLNSRAADPANNTGVAWAKLGTVSVMGNTSSSVQNARPDLIWLITGGEDPTTDKSSSYQLRVSIRDTAGNGYVNYHLSELQPGPVTGAPTFGYIYDNATGVATIYARLTPANNPMTVVQLNKGAGGIEIVYMGHLDPPVPTMMTASASNAALQAQVDALQTQVNTLSTNLTTLQNDVITGFNALTAAINAM